MRYPGQKSITESAKQTHKRGPKIREMPFPSLTLPPHLFLSFSPPFPFCSLPSFLFPASSITKQLARAKKSETAISSPVRSSQSPAKNYI